MSPAQGRLKAALRSLWMLFLYLLIPSVILMFAMFAMGLGSAVELPDVLSDILTVIGFILAIRLIAGRLKKKHEVPFAQAVGLRRDPPIRLRLAATLVGVGVAAGFAVSAIVTLLPLSPATRANYDFASLAAFQGSARLVAVAIALFFSPFIEEIFFRGFLFVALREGFSDKVAICAPAAVFALLHGDPVWIAYAFVMGSLFGYLAMRFDDLAVPAMAHFGFNLSSMPALFARPGGWYASLDQKSLFPVLMLAVGAAAACLLTREALKQAPTKKP
jgi:membrane protease YdiL (CAAX protease family)